MTQSSRVALRPTVLRVVAPKTLAMAFAVAVMATAGPVLAQPSSDPRIDSQVEPWRNPAPPPGKPRNATSGEEATKPTDSEQREARKLATAIFSAPSAGQRAADKAAPPGAANVPPAQPKPEWVAPDKVGAGGEGVQVKAPF